MSRGGGATEMLGVGSEVDLHIGTLSKAFGCLGGFVACNKQWKDYLINCGRTQVGHCAQCDLHSQEPISMLTPTNTLE